MKRYSIAFSMLVLILSSCSIFSSNSKHSEIVGQWEWIRSVGGLFTQVSTPDSVGVPNSHFNFNSDNTFSFFRADTLVTTGKYSLQQLDDNTIISYDTKNDVLFTDQRVTFKGSDTLILTDRCSDCFTDTYFRTNIRSPNLGYAII